jgi:regulator of sirC expression with transglutaminase-like and TPR domain
VVAYNMANAYSQVKDMDMALRFVNAALELDPEHGPSLKLKARLQAEG